MSGLNTSLMVAMQSLLAQQGALDATTNNIANVNTPGYTREVPVLREAPATPQANYSIGNGVVLEKYQSVRDQILEQRIQQVTQQNASAQAQTNSLAASRDPVHLLRIRHRVGDVGALHQYHATADRPCEHAYAAGNSDGRPEPCRCLPYHGDWYRAGASRIEPAGDPGRGADQPAYPGDRAFERATVDTSRRQGQDGGTVEDQLNVLIGKLSALTDVNVTQTESGLTLTTGTRDRAHGRRTEFRLQTATGS